MDVPCGWLRAGLGHCRELWNTVEAVHEHRSSGKSCPEGDDQARRGRDAGSLGQVRVCPGHIRFIPWLVLHHGKWIVVAHTLSNE